MRIRIIDDSLLDDVSAQQKLLPVCEGGKAKLNYNFHQSLDEKCHRMMTC